MIKEIKYSGLAAVPSDYDCPDGQLAQSLNLLNETGSMQPIFPPKVLRTLGSYECLCIHEAGGIRRLILYRHNTQENRGEIFTLPYDADENEAPELLACDFISRPSVAILGSTLMLSDGHSTSYILYSIEKQKYILLGSSIPEISMQFALARNIDTAEYYTDSVSIGLPEDFSQELIAKILTVLPGRRGGNDATHIPDSGKTEAVLRLISDAILGFVNKMNVETAQDNKFIHPFLLRWALRLYDGSYIHQSAPILMVPNSGMPPLSYVHSLESETILNLELKSYCRRCSLMFRPSGISELSDWTDIVKSIDVFVSQPIYTYDQSGTISPAHRSDEDSSIFSHSGSSTSYQSAPEATLLSGESLAMPSDEGNYHRHPSTIDPDSVPQYDFGTSGNKESWFSDNPPTQSIRPAPFSRRHIEAGITTASSFHLIASIPLTGEDAISDLPAFTPLDLDDSSLSTLSNRSQLPDDWRSHDIIHFNVSFSYNSRLSLAGITSTLFPGFPIADMSQYWYDPDSSQGDIQCTVWTKLVRNFSSHWVCRTCTLSGGHLPRFLFYPDTTAVEMRIICPDGSGWQLPMKTHDFLNGAYWFDGLSKTRTPRLAQLLPPGSETTKAPDPSKLFLSEVGNPFFFPVTNRVTVGTGHIRGLSSAAKALSQGQFGQFPLYAFTDEGVWALEVSATGTYSARQPITRDIILAGTMPLQLDSAVLFATDRGIMLLSGSQTQCISETLDDTHSTEGDNPKSLPGLSAAFPEFNYSDITFTDYIKNCRMAYDYVNQRIIVFNPDKSYTYVYSMKTKLWGMQECSLTSVINSYPDALAMAKGDGENNLVDLSHTDAEEVRCLLVSRPIKLDSPDVLKTITTAIQRGILPPIGVSTILYATRDYLNWHLISSSRSHSIRSYRGTPYKAFRIVSVSTLRKGGAISGCSIDFVPRMTNKLR